MDVLDYLYIYGERKATPLPKTEVKTDVHGYYKTPVGGVISRDNESLRVYRQQKGKVAQLNTMKEEINQIKSDLAEIKELLKGLTTKE